MPTPEYDHDKINWLETFKRNDLPATGPLPKGLPPILVMLDGTTVSTEEESKPAVSSDVVQHLEKRARIGRPPGSGPNQRAAAAAAATASSPSAKLPALAEALPAGGEDEEKPEDQEPTMPTKPRTQTLPGATGTGAVIVRELPIEAIHEAIEQNYYENGVELRVHYKNDRGTPIQLGKTLVALDALASDLEEWLRSNFGGGCFRVDARDPLTGKRALPIPVFEVSIHAPRRLMSNGTVLPLGQTAPAIGMQGSPAMTSGFQGPWVAAPAGGTMGTPLMPGNVQTSQQQQPPWMQAAMQGYGPPQTPGVHHVPVMSMPPDQIAMAELQKAQTALERERAARVRDTNEFTKKLEAITQELNDRRLKEEDRARQSDALQMREQMRRLEENFRLSMEQERNKRPAVDLTGLASIVAAVVPVVTAMISTRGDQASRSLEMQAQGVNNLMKATLERGDSKWVEKAIAALPLIIPVLGPLFKTWAEQKSPAAQADLVATLSENHLTALSMMAKLMNEMVTSSGPDLPPWVGVFQQMVGTVVQSVDSMVRSNKNSVGLQTQSRHLPSGAPQPVQQPAQQQQPAQPGMTPAQAAMGMAGAQSSFEQPQVQFSPAPTGAQIAQLAMMSPEVPADFKTPQFLKLVEDLHNQVDVDTVATFFANHLRELEDNVPEALRAIWQTDQPEQLLQSVFMNLPIWQWNEPYTVAFIKKTVDILTTPEHAPMPAQAVQSPVSAIQFFSQAVATPA